MLNRQSITDIISKSSLNPNSKSFFPIDIESTLENNFTPLNPNAVSFISNSVIATVDESKYDVYKNTPIQSLCCNYVDPSNLHTNDKQGVISDKISPDNSDNLSQLNFLRIQNPNKVLLGHININSIRHKFDMLSDIIKEKLDIFLITETKLNGSFPTNQFLMAGYSPPYRRDRRFNGGGGLLLYIREDIPSKLVSSLITKKMILKLC